MATAMDKWAAEQDETRENEGEELNRDQMHSHEEENYGAAEYGQAETRDAASVMDDEDAAHQAKKAKDMKIIKMVGAGLGVFALAVVGVSFFSSDNSVQYSNEAPPEIVSPIVQPTNAPVAPVVDAPQSIQVPAQTVINEDYAVAPVEPQEKASTMASVAVAATGNQIPVTATAQPVMPEKAPASTGDTTIIDALRSENSALRAELQTQRGLVKSLQANLDARIKAAQKSITGAPKPVTQAANTAVKPLPTTAKNNVVAQQKKITAEAVKAKTDAVTPDGLGAVVEQQVLQNTKQTPSLPSPQNKGSKVRAEFTVYAVSNGRAWVTWAKDGLNYTVGTNSELPDYSKVTSIDDSTGVVFTNAGEIHPRPPTK